MALLLPLQSFAATTMLLCGPTHHGQPQHESAPDAGSASHEHHAPAKPAGGKCSACAACCMSTAIAPATIVLPVLPATAVYAAHAFAVPLAVITSELERPPRSLLA